ncbi:hypothetical protein [Ascidiaceihabitans sp.]|uniref:hypothetical protein n=1 Tax=Ascidiaceihabitans sp. TaxID=1872644 RepID=UPI0032970CBD
MIPDTWMKGPLMWTVLFLTFIAILTVVVWDLATQQAEQRIRAEQSAKNHIQYAEDRIDKECLGLEPVSMRNCIHQEIEAARDHDRANQDLKAQENMAFFTKVMGYTAVMGLVLGIVSIGVIFATLREMASTNMIMREEQRPWLVIDKAPFDVLGKMYRSTPNSELSLTVTNKGKLPAKSAVATFATFSHDTMTAFEVSNIIERILLDTLDKAKLEVDLSRICAAPSARLGHFSLEGDGAFPAQC